MPIWHLKDGPAKSERLAKFTATGPCRVGLVGYLCRVFKRGIYEIINSGGVVGAEDNVYSWT